ncbi:hypothetical protein [Pseudomonas sp.]|uniref:hypothetical protein n=1 Tax=Pseudomonas sp. TaxID=306 RepID=UPI003FD708EF
MNEELQKALLAILNKTVSASEAGMSFLQKELPEVIQQLLMWKAFESAAFFLTFAALTFLFVTMAIKLFKAARSYKPKNSYDDADGYYFCVFGLSLVSALFLLLALANLSWLKIILAPKLYLIEFAASLAK